MNMQPRVSVEHEIETIDTARWSQRMAEAEGSTMRALGADCERTP